MLDNKLRWDAWTDCKQKATTDNVLSFNVDSRMLMFYGAFIKSIKTFCVICWYGNASGVRLDILIRFISIK